MTAFRLWLGASFRVAALLVSLPAILDAQFGVDRAIGQYYSIEQPQFVDRSFFAVRIERTAPGSLAMPPPLDVVPVRVAMRAFTGQVTELPQRGRVYFTVVDEGGALRLVEVDLIRRDSRVIDPPPGYPIPLGVQMLVTPRLSKLYVQWFGPGYLPETHIYDAESLAWLGRTLQFFPDERAAGFEARDPYLWTVDAAGRPVLIDTQRDVVETSFDHQRWFGPVPAVVSDAWRDVLLYRIDVGHDRYQLVDVRSGEIGPPLDLEGYGMVQPRLAMDSRLLVLIDIERRPWRTAGSYAETAVALGGGIIYALRDGSRAGDFHLAVPYDLPAASLGTTDDPGIPGRLWIHGPRDDERIDLGLPGCQRSSRGGDDIEARLVARWDGPHDPYIYRYRLAVAEGSGRAAGAVAIKAGRQTQRSGAPDGWGMDLINREQWLRWSNGLGPAEEDVAPGTVLDGYVLSADRETRPGIVEFRIQAALGLPRGCESDDRFLDNSRTGWTVAPERLDTIDPKRRAERLERLTKQACEIGWVEAGDCPRLESLAHRLVDARSERAANLESFRSALAEARLSSEAAVVLGDAALSIQEILVPLP
ncbi:MAG TPA: hypothetical protein VLC48_09565 [Gemmatimonadota bacterium]|nr:hypothetical protein [Gemmatimonadota bacterium]